MKKFLTRYKYYLIVYLVLFVVLVGLLVFASLGKEDIPFVYQIF